MSGRQKAECGFRPCLPEVLNLFLIQGEKSKILDGLFQ